MYKTLSLSDTEQQKLLQDWQTNQNMKSKEQLIYSHNKFILHYIANFPQYCREDLYSVALIAVQKTGNHVKMSGGAVKSPKFLSLNITA